MGRKKGEGRVEREIKGKLKTVPLFASGESRKQVLDWGLRSSRPIVFLLVTDTKQRVIF